MRYLSGDDAWRYGFRWDQVDVTRAASHKGYKFLSVETDKQRLQLAITPTGLIRVFGPYCDAKKKVR